MPELPEVEVVRRGLEPHVRGRRIRLVDVYEPRSVRKHALGYEHFSSTLIGETIQGVARRGKFLWFELDQCDDAVVTHLGMSGQLRVQTTPEACVRSVEPTSHEGPASDPIRHLRIRMVLDTGTQIDFIDQRIFGGMQMSACIPTADGFPAGAGTENPRIPNAVSHIARDLLDPHFDQAACVGAIRRRQAPIKNLLLAQNLVSGIGNIYADEALWTARVHYARPGASLASTTVHRILDEAKAVMLRALEVGGTSFDSLYVNVDGRSGYFARSLHAYGREGQPCDRCERPLVREMNAGRSSYFCRFCQKRPKKVRSAKGLLA